jgi:hypothetical protein
LRLTLPGLLLALTALLAGGDAAWAVLGHLQLDIGAYLRLGLMAAALLAGARLYQTVRPDPRLAAMLFGTGFLCAFSVGASLLNYLLLTHTGARIDVPLAALDRAMGFDWPAVMSWMAAHPRLNAVAFIAYDSMLPQVAPPTRRRRSIVSAPRWRCRPWSASAYGAWRRPSAPFRFMDRCRRT